MRTSDVASRTVSARSYHPLVWAAAAFLALFLPLGGWAAAQGQTNTAALGEVHGTQIVLPDGNRCLPLPPAERDAVAGTTLQYYCGDGVPKGLVGGVLESAGQVSLEVVDLSGQQADQPAGQAADLSRLAIFPVQQLVLEDGAVCLPASQVMDLGDGRHAYYECQGGGQGLVVLGSLYSLDDQEYATSYVNVARLDQDGALLPGSEDSVAVTVIDGALPLTKVDWVLASWGAGMAPPTAGAAPTLAFRDGMVNGTTGCNSYFAPATILAEGQLLLGVAGSTLMACSEELMAQEFRFMAALDGVTGYELIAGDLYLYGGAEVIRFTPAL